MVITFRNNLDDSGVCMLSHNGLQLFGGIDERGAKPTFFVDILLA